MKTLIQKLYKKIEAYFVSRWWERKIDQEMKDAYRESGMLIDQHISKDHRLAIGFEALQNPKSCKYSVTVFDGDFGRITYSGEGQGDDNRILRQFIANYSRGMRQMHKGFRRKNKLIRSLRRKLSQSLLEAFNAGGWMNEPMLTQWLRGKGVTQGKRLKYHNETDGQVHYELVHHSGERFEVNANSWDYRTFGPAVEWALQVDKRHG